MGIIMHKGVAYGGGGIDAIADASDVNLSSPVDGQILKYDATNEEWVNVSLGTAAYKDYTSSVTSGSTDLVTSGAVKSAIDAAVSSAYHAAGSKDVDELLPSLLVAGNLGNVYDMNDGGETTEYFVEGAGLPIRAGDNVGIVNVGTDADPVYKFDLLSGFVDLSDYYDSDEVDELLADKANTADLGDLASIDIDGSGSTKFLRGDGTWQNQAAQAQSDWNQTDSSASDYIKNKPTIPDAQIQSDWDQTTTTAKDYIKNKPTIPSVGNGTITIQKNGTAVDTFTTNQSSAKTINITMAKSDVGLDNVPNVTTDNQTPTVTEATTRANIASGDTLKTIIGKIKKFFADLKTVAFTGSYNDLTDKPTIPSGQVQSDWNQTTTTAVDYIKNKPTIPAAQVNSDWNASSGVAQILNKPTIPAAQIQSDWNQTTTTAKDYIKNKPSSMPASDVYSWAKASTKPTYTASDVGAIPLSGSSAITGDLTPDQGYSYNLGDASKRWLNIYGKIGQFRDSIKMMDYTNKYYTLTLQAQMGTYTADRTISFPNEDGTLATREWIGAPANDTFYLGGTNNRFKALYLTALSNTITNSGNWSNVTGYSEICGRWRHIYLRGTTKSIAINTSYGVLKYLSMEIPIPSGIGWRSDGWVLSLTVEANGGLNFASFNGVKSNGIGFYLTTSQNEGAKVYYITAHYICAP